MRKTIFILTFFIIISAFSQEKKLGKSELKYYKELIKHFRSKSINKDSIDWENFEKKILKKALISRDSAIKTALTINGESHSFYYKLDNKIRIYGNFESKPFLGKRKKINDIKIENSGYIKINHFISSKTSLKETIERSKIYINKNIENIKSNDSENLKCWIIDLRNNGGGQMWPMIISLTPFLKEGNIGYTVKGKKETNWRKVNGEILYGKRNKTKKYLGKPFNYSLKNPRMKVAVLINEWTTSSAEATAIAVLSNSNVKFFGTKTFGYTSNNTSIKMKNGDYLHLTTGFWKNYNGKKFKDGIIPDFESCNEKELKESLKNWIKK
jgi:C-terminal processing protease CtpA/Prc